MVYVLHGGPRAGQIVDDLPNNYRIDKPQESPQTVEVFDGLMADVARWRPMFG
ncbi:hypothetical protein FHX49_001461 [Microbacterium endophyticum]|uniref:Uncharacterized protein n=1 Tax=Microbacterium endophyticum TaxID=1526412 RepID=A0A7W4YMU9_9MICO|nr:hypothetical protein [Microbacterium endophyticum]MBB2975894.1 hypothetical protein [Microbacterium endophyticum]NIK36377.1 hypothetical protein [Microbacterium endophyticum]